MRKIFYLTLLLCLIPLVSAVPTPHAVQGYIYGNNGSQVPLGTPVFISWQGHSIQIATFGPPTHTGWYAVMIDAEDGNRVKVSSSYGGYYGSNSKVINSTTTNINITLNQRFLLKYLALRHLNIYRNFP